MIFLTMEETFILTYIIVIMVGVVFGFLTYRIFEADNKGDYIV